MPLCGTAALGGESMKNMLACIVLCVCCAGLFAYNPPYGGEELFRLTNPELMRGAASAAGGPDFTVVPSSITYNPALSAGEQRVGIDLSGTAFFNNDKIRIEGAKSDKSVGGGFQAGMIIPTRWSVFSFTTSALFADFYGMDVRKTAIVHAGVAKELTDRLCVGGNIYTGFYMGSGADFSIGADLGALYKMEDFGIFQSPRLGFSLLNMGKPADYDTLGIDDDASSSPYPSIFTPRASFAATLFRAKKWTGGFSADAAFPAFQNCIADLGFGVDYNNFVRLSAAWQANIREIAEGGMDGLSSFSVGASFRIGITSKTISEKNADWERSEIVPAVATQSLYSGIQAVSFGAKLDLGLKDTEAPEIYMWNEAAK